MENLVTVKELAVELKISPKALRKRIRDNGIEKPSTRWEWEEDHPDVITIRNWKTKGREPKKPEPQKEEDLADLLPKINDNNRHEEVDFGSPHQEPQVVFEKKKDGYGWEILKGEEGVKAIYNGKNSKDQTPWITAEDQIRKTLPKYLKEAIKEAL